MLSTDAWFDGTMIDEAPQVKKVSVNTTLKSLSLKQLQMLYYLLLVMFDTEFFA